MVIFRKNLVKKEGNQKFVTNKYNQREVFLTTSKNDKKGLIKDVITTKKFKKGKEECKNG